MPQLMLSQTPAGPRFHLDGQELMEGDPIAIVDGEGVEIARGTFAWTGQTRDAPWIVSLGGSRKIMDGSDVRRAVETLAVEDGPYFPPNARALTEWKRRNSQ